MAWRSDVQGFERRARGTLSGFRAFILRGNVVDLAIGIVIGTAFTAVVTKLVNDLITPLIGIFGGFNFPDLVYTVNKSKFAVGDFLNAIISFVILALVVYFFVVKPVNALMAHYKPKEVEAPPTTRDCPYCLSSVPLQATRCAYCTSPLPPPGQAAQPIPPAQQ